MTGRRCCSARGPAPGGPAGGAPAAPVPTHQSVCPVPGPNFHPGGLVQVHPWPDLWGHHSRLAAGPCTLCDCPVCTQHLPCYSFQIVGWAAACSLVLRRCQLVARLGGGLDSYNFLVRARAQQVRRFACTVAPAWQVSCAHAGCGSAAPKGLCEACLQQRWLQVEQQVRMQVEGRVSCSSRQPA